MHRPFFVPIAVLALTLIPATAVAEGCLDKVRELARSQNISTDPPTASPDKAPGAPGQGTGPGVTSRELGRSGGVIEPPATADRTALQALLVAARAEAERGQEAGCLDALEKARKLLKRTEK